MFVSDGMRFLGLIIFVVVVAWSLPATDAATSCTRTEQAPFLQPRSTKSRRNRKKKINSPDAEEIQIINSPDETDVPLPFNRGRPEAVVIHEEDVGVESRDGHSICPDQSTRSTIDTEVKEVVEVDRCQTEKERARETLARCPRFNGHYGSHLRNASKRLSTLNLEMPKQMDRLGYNFPNYGSRKISLGPEYLRF